MMATTQHNRQLLSDLLMGFAAIAPADDIEIYGVSQFSGDTQQGDVFLATANGTTHGLSYQQDAVARGAAAIVWETAATIDAESLDCTVPNVEVPALSKHVFELIQRFYGPVSQGLSINAVTGTDGKSSVTHLLAQALDSLGHNCGLIGTLGYGRLSQLNGATHTTPPPARLVREFSQLVEQGCQQVAIEASSHALAQGRLNELKINTAILTNISHDHLDYHQTQEEYIAAKAKLFFDANAEYVVLNIDDAVAEAWAQSWQQAATLISYSVTRTDADVYASSIRYSADGVDLNLHLGTDCLAIHSKLLGPFNISNLLAVAAALSVQGFSRNQVKSSLEQLLPVPGRMQIVPSTARHVIVDFAHTANALQAAIAAVRVHYSGRLICVFGCGGERDQAKRQMMGEVAARYADEIIITNDNPRTESPSAIAAEILDGAQKAATKGQAITVILDRKQAIATAINHSTAADVILLAGKGHEAEQQIGNQKFPFDDALVAAELLNGRTDV
ncbi:MAG: UDP-N-acetylmuramoyl-L-alanyl-D-glutamate--2,6-diaminopimelate ligase [Gammaproteobacteria bacterium]|nr:UDP-N-acetylmuramoyl-L-alanyl-D-glutamate--2,6-diaminopimelate ligase [Gammaproteobacteria bacterium]